MFALKVPSWSAEGGKIPFVDDFLQVLATHPHLGKCEGIPEQLALAHEVEVTTQILLCFGPPNAGAVPSSDVTPFALFGPAPDDSVP